MGIEWSVELVLLFIRFGCSLGFLIVLILLYRALDRSIKEQERILYGGKRPKKQK